MLGAVDERTATFVKCCLPPGKKHGITELHPDVVSYVSHATQQRLQNLVEKISETAQQKNFSYKVTHCSPEEATLAVDSKSALLGSLFPHQAWGAAQECFLELRFGGDAASLSPRWSRALCAPAGEGSLACMRMHGRGLAWVGAGAEVACPALEVAEPLPVPPCAPAASS